jgi:uncharacterized membrane protein
MARLDRPRFPNRVSGHLPLVGPWPDGPWWLLAAAALAAPIAMLWQGADMHVAVAAALACLASPSAAIEAILGVARLTLLASPPQR